MRAEGHRSALGEVLHLAELPGSPRRLQAVGRRLRRAPLDALPVPARRAELVRVRQVSGAAGSQLWQERVSGLPTPRAETHR